MKKYDPSLEQSMQERLDILKEMPERNSASAARGRTQFLAQAKSFRASLSGPVPARPRFRLFHGTGRPLPAMNWVTAVVVALVLFFASSAVTVYASQGSLPGDGLYPVKLLSEDGRLFFTFSPTARLNLTLDLTDRRIAEISKLQSEGRPIPADVIERFNAEMDSSLKLSAKMKDVGLRQSLAAVSAHTENQLKIMDRLLEGNNSSPQLMGTQARLEEQLEEANSGRANPQEFRQEIEKKSNAGNNQPDGRPKDDFILTPTSTITPTPTERFHKPTHTPRTPEPKGNPGSVVRPTPNH